MKRSFKHPALIARCGRESDMRVMILGGDGYLGWPTAMAFRRAGHEVWRSTIICAAKWRARPNPTR